MTDEQPKQEKVKPQRVVKHTRRLRHWKQQFDENAAFVWRRPLKWKGKTMKVGDKLSKRLIKEMGRAKLRRFWESHAIELCDFSAPEKILPEQVELPKLIKQDLGIEDEEQEPQTDAGAAEGTEAPVPSDASPELQEQAVEGEQGDIEPAPEND